MRLRVSEVLIWIGAVARAPVEMEGVYVEEGSEDVGGASAPDPRKWFAYIGHRTGVSSDKRVTLAATLNARNNFVAVCVTEEAATPDLAAEIEARGEEPSEACWVFFRGRRGYTGVVDTLAEHNAHVPRASEVKNRKF